ncbi:MAG: hypothetical protein IKB25_04700 [Lentisphaeria bacterium]|nr:hypothetical protein [Lentisphaeria bacterium]
MLSHLLIVLGYIFLCLSGISFAVSLGLAIFSRNRKGFLVPAIYLLMMVLLLAFVSIYPGGGSEAWTTVLFYIICISFQFVWVGKLRHQANKVLKWSFVSTLLTSGFLLCAMILMNSSLAFQ